MRNVKSHQLRMFDPHLVVIVNSRECLFFFFFRSRFHAFFVRGWFALFILIPCFVLPIARGETCRYTMFWFDCVRFLVITIPSYNVFYVWFLFNVSDNRKHGQRHILYYSTRCCVDAGVKVWGNVANLLELAL